MNEITGITDVPDGKILRRKLLDAPGRVLKAKRSHKRLFKKALIHGAWWSAFWLSIFILWFKIADPNFIIAKSILGEKQKTQVTVISQEKIISDWIKKTNRTVPIEMTSIIASEICKKTYKSGLPLPLIVAIIQRESHFDPLAVSSSKAAGLMQVLNGGKGIAIDKDRMFDISYNIEKGIEIFNEHLRLQKGDLDRALFGYVGGDRTYANDIYKIIGEFEMYYEACKKAAEIENKEIKKDKI